MDLKQNQDKSVPELINMNYSEVSFNTITKPTRVPSTTATLIDYIWSNNLRNNYVSEIIYDYVSEFSICSTKKYKESEKSAVSYRNYITEQIAKLKILIY